MSAVGLVASLGVCLGAAGYHASHKQDLLKVEAEKLALSAAHDHRGDIREAYRAGFESGFAGSKGVVLNINESSLPEGAAARDRA